MKKKKNSKRRQTTRVCRSCGLKQQGSRWGLRKATPERCIACGGMCDTTGDIAAMKRVADQN